MRKRASLRRAERNVSVKRSRDGGSCSLGRSRTANSAVVRHPRRVAWWLAWPI